MIDPDGKEHTDGQCAAYTPAQPHLLLLCPHNVSLSLSESLCLAVAAVGVGAVDSVFKAIERIVNQEFVLDNFTVQSVTDSSDALGMPHRDSQTRQAARPAA